MTFKELDKKKFAGDYQKNTLSKLATAYGKPRATIATWVRRMKLKKPKLKTKGLVWTRTQENLLLKYYNQIPIADLQKKLKKSRWAVINKFRELKKNDL